MDNAAIEALLNEHRTFQPSAEYSAQANVNDRAIYKQAAELAEKEKMPVEQLVTLAVTQALGAWTTQSLIAERAKRGNREKFLAGKGTGEWRDWHKPERQRRSQLQRGSDRGR